MEAISLHAVGEALQQFSDQNIYLHLETTNGAYAALEQNGNMTVCAYIRNGLIRFSRGLITGRGSYRVGLKMDIGWIYAEGLTDWEFTCNGQLLMAGHDGNGRLAVALQLSRQPFTDIGLEG